MQQKKQNKNKIISEFLLNILFHSLQINNLNKVCPVFNEQ